ncbi:MAG: trypsin-like peptidase domain-containing protein [Candidatus Melainabacteria bacterium]|nr:trypsin-like peptidase domain-containing protein [Candidatus Melainabacteria bacterium]
MTNWKRLVALAAIALVFSAFILDNKMFAPARAESRNKQNESAAGRATKLLSALSDDGNTLLFQGNRIADIAEAAAPAVVNIEVEKPSAPGLQAMMPFGPNGGRFFFNNREIDPERLANLRPIKQTGSGFIVRPEGFILTNAHVVKGAKRIEVTLNDGRNIVATIVGIDTFSDLAVLKIDAANLPILQMGSSTNLRPGEFAIAIGSPLGYDHTVTLGIVSAVGRNVYDINDNINFIQTDAAINTGNSGGPLLNLKGEVIGVNTAVVKGFVAQNIGFSIPVDIAKSVCDDLIAHKKILRPWLGIAMKELSETMTKSLGMPPTTRGVVVVEIYPGSPAEKAGLRKQDVIQKIDGKDVQSRKDVRDYVRSRKIEDTLNFYILRGGTGEALAVHLGEYPDHSSESSQTSEE